MSTKLQKLITLAAVYESESKLMIKTDTNQTVITIRKQRSVILESEGIECTTAVH